MFQIQLQSWYDLRAGLLKYSSLQPSEMAVLPFFELEELLDSLQKLNEKEEEERKKREKGESQPNINLNSMSRQISSSMPKMPDFKF